MSEEVSVHHAARLCKRVSTRAMGSVSTIQHIWHGGCSPLPPLCCDLAGS